MTGYTPIRSIGRGGSAEVWLARAADGREVALKRTTPDAVAAARAAAALGHPNVLGLLDVCGDTLVMPYVPGGSLAAALAAGARYATAQAAALGAALASALAAAHAAGLVHGDVKAGNVLLAASGSPLLADFRGTAPAAPGSPRSSRTPAGDVADLATLLTRLAPALAPVVAGAATAAELRDRLASLDIEVDGVDPEPTRDHGPRPPAAPAPEPARAARLPRVPATVRAVALAAAVLAIAVVAGWSLPQSRPAGALPPAPAVDWRSTLAALDATRSAAFARSDARGLDRVYVAGSRPLRSDRALLARHAKAGTRVADLHLVASDVRPVRVTADTAVLDVTDRLLPYTVVDSAGRPVQRWDGRGARRWRITLRTVSGEWRIAEIGRAPGVAP